MSEQTSQPGPSRDSAMRAPLASALLFLGAFLAIGALFPAYYAHGKSLAGDPENLWFNIPVVVGWLVAAALLAFGFGAPAGVGLAVGVTVVDIAYVISDVASVVARDNHVAAGFVLGNLSSAACIAGTAVAVVMLRRRIGVRWQVGRSTAVWAGVMCVAGVIFAVGFVLPDYSYGRHLASGTFSAIGSSTYKNTCCSPFQHQQGYTIAQTILILAIAVLVPIAAASLLPRSVGSGLFAGISVALAAEWASAAAYLATTNATPALFGYTAAQVQQYGVTVSLHPAIGYWIETAAVAILFVVTVARALGGSGAMAPQQPFFGPRQRKPDASSVPVSDPGSA